MKVAALYDIHGNLPALEAVLKELESVQPDVIVVGGDIVSGPMPGQTLECLRQLAGNVIALRGNADREVLTAFDCQEQNLAEKEYKVAPWVAQHLEADQRDFLARLPEWVTLSLEGLGEVLFCHATPHSDEVIFTQLTPPDRLRLLFEDVKQPVVVCGHTHIQFELHIGSMRVVNAGSVGMPFADHPGAYWLLLSSEGIQFRRTLYDLEAAAQTIRTSGYPQAQEFAEENVLKVPTAEEAMEVFEQSITAG